MMLKLSELKYTFVGVGVIDHYVYHILESDWNSLDDEEQLVGLWVLFVAAQNTEPNKQKLNSLLRELPIKEAQQLVDNYGTEAWWDKTDKIRKMSKIDEKDHPKLL